MKLVDILAGELKVWPENSERVWQSLSGRLFLGKDRERLTVESYTLAKDWDEARVTRAEWQAAVDALNSPKVVEWDGKGMPPVGVDCEYRVGGATWFECNIRYVTTPYHDCPVEVVMFPAHLKSEQTAVVGDGEGEVSFRPIRTAEQVAAEEIEAIREFLIYEHRDGGLIGIAKALHESGYRKEPKPCGS